MSKLPLIILLIFISPMILFLLLVAKLFLKGKAASWEGVVVDKGHVVREKQGQKGVILRVGQEKKEHFYHIKVQLDNGETHAIAVPAKMYEEIKVGDRLKKEKDALWPKKI